MIKRSPSTSKPESRKRSQTGMMWARDAMRALLLVPMLMVVFAAAPGAVSPALAADLSCPPATPSTAASGASGTAPAAATPAPNAAAMTPVAFPAEGGKLTVFAAASLTDAFNKMKTDLQAEHLNLEITFQTGGSQALVTQLQAGAKADVLATANNSTMKTAVDGDLIERKPVPFTGNRLVIVTPKDNPAKIASLDDLGKDGIRLVIAGADVPAGKYALQAICSYGSKGAAPADFVTSVGNNVVSEETDVRSVLAKVQLGEADAGIVYASDAVAAKLSGSEVNAIEFPATVPATATYPIAPVAGGNTGLANAFIAYVLSPDGQKVLAEYGFKSAP
ncbi:MAG: molybdate ABC transporter substrate-binding protein [Thermomicrobiales bacterium]